MRLILLASAAGLAILGLTWALEARRRRLEADPIHDLIEANRPKGARRPVLSKLSREDYDAALVRAEETRRRAALAAAAANRLRTGDRQAATAAVRPFARRA